MTINYTALFARVVELMTNPRHTWELIAEEPDPGRELVFRYVLLLAMIPASFGFLGNLLYGEGFFFSLFFSLLLLGVFAGSVFAFGLLISAMAPSFGAKKDENLSFKLVAYVSTPIWVFGFLMLVPDLTLLAALLGFGYAAYLFYVGCQVLLETPEQNALKFAIVSLTIWFVVMLMLSMAAHRIADLLFAHTAIPVKNTNSHPYPFSGK